MDLFVIYLFGIDNKQSKMYHLELPLQTIIIYLLIKKLVLIINVFPCDEISSLGDKLKGCEFKKKVVKVTKDLLEFF
jgi:hypothetical protein